MTLGCRRIFFFFFFFFAGCAKYRFNSTLQGHAPLGFPKVLDVGQCNDISGAIAVASALAAHYKCSVNQLPLSFAVSWLEQKAVAQLLTCLSLGIQGIKYTRRGLRILLSFLVSFCGRLGPALPAWLSPTVLDVLVKNYNVSQVSSPAVDFGARLHLQ
jgi:hydroxylamine reductase